jgi:hypothetical protein
MLPTPSGEQVGSEGKQNHYHARLSGLPVAELYDFEEPRQAS